LIHELKRKMDERNYEAHILTQAQCLAKWPALQSAYCKEGIYFPQEVSAEPNSMIYKLLFYLTRKFQTVRYQPNTSVWGCEVTNGKVKITTHKGELYKADKVIICSGHEFNTLFTSIFKSSGIVISKLNMLRTIPYPAVNLEGNILTGLTIRRYESFQECPSYSNISTPNHLQELTKWGIHILFKKVIDHSIIIGDSHEYAAVNEIEKLGFDLNQEINNIMLMEAARIVHIPNLQIASSWAGFYSQHPEKDIVEIDIEEKIHIRTAIGGKGMTSSAGYAKQSIQQIFAT